MLYSWNEYVLALMMLEMDHTTLPVGVAIVASGKMAQNYGTLSALLVMTLLPAVLFFIALQRYVVKGMMAGALKA